MAKRYVYEIDSADRAQICDADLGPDDACALDTLVDQQFLSLALLRLKPREERVIRLRYGIGGHGEATYREIGDELGLSVESVRQIHAKSIRKLRWHARRYYPEKPIEQNLARDRLSAWQRKPANPSRPRRQQSRPGPVRTPQRQELRPNPGRKLSPVPTSRPQVWAQQHDKAKSGEPLVSGKMLSLFIACFLIAIGFDPVIAFNLTKAMGSAATLGLHLIAAFSGLMMFALLLEELQYSSFDHHELEQRWPVVRCALLVAVSAACLLPPIQQLLQQMVASTPVRYRSPMPEVVTLFAVVMMTTGSRYLLEHQKRRRARAPAGPLKS